jgi:hypothetical protein
VEYSQKNTRETETSDCTCGGKVNGCMTEHRDLIFTLHFWQFLKFESCIMRQKFLNLEKKVNVISEHALHTLFSPTFGNLPNRHKRNTHIGMFITGPGVMVHTCNQGYSGGRAWKNHRG